MGKPRGQGGGDKGAGWLVGWLGYLTELGGCSQSEDASWRNRQVLGWV